MFLYRKKTTMELNLKDYEGLNTDQFDDAELPKPDDIESIFGHYEIDHDAISKEVERLRNLPKDDPELKKYEKDPVEEKKNLLKMLKSPGHHTMDYKKRKQMIAELERELADEV